MRLRAGNENATAEPCDGYEIKLVQKTILMAARRTGKRRDDGTTDARTLANSVISVLFLGGKKIIINE